MKNIKVTNKTFAKYVKDFFSQILYAPLAYGKHTVTIEDWAADVNEDKLTKNGDPTIRVKLTCKFEDGQTKDLSFYNVGITYMVHSLMDQLDLEFGNQLEDTLDSLKGKQADVWKTKTNYLDANKVKQEKTEYSFFDPNTLDDDDIDVVDHI